MGQQDVDKGDERTKGAVDSGILRNSTLNFLGQVVPLGIAAVAVPFIVRDLGIERYGLLSLSWILLGYVSFLDFGLGRATTNAVAFFSTKGQQEETAGVVWVSLGINLAVGAVGTLLALWFTPMLVERVFSVPGELREEAVGMFVMLAFSVPLVTLAMTLRGVLEGVHRFDLANVVKAPSLGMMFLIPMFGKPFALDLGEIVGLIVLSRLVTLLVYAVFVFRQIPNLLKFHNFRSMKVGFLLRFAGWITVSNIFSPVLNYAERLLIPALQPLGVLGFYTAPYEIISRLPMLPASVAATLFPTFSSNKEGDFQAGILDLLVKPTKYLLFLMTPIASVFIFLAPEILELWLGAVFRERSMFLLPVLSLGFFFNCLAHIPLAAVQGLGRPHWRARLDMLEAVLFLSLTVFLIRAFGINGAALSKSLVLFLDVVVMFVLVRRILNVPWSTLIPRQMLAFIVLSLVFLLAGLCLTVLDFSFPIRMLSFSIGLTIVVSLFWFQTLPEERDSMRALVNRFIAR